jgi:branched-chain amino acid transport system substrate-binding protein
MNRKITLIVLLVISVVGILAYRTTRDKEPGFVLKIGAILPLTGSAASYGQNSLDGATLAMEQINAGEVLPGLGLKIAIESQDSGGNASKAVSAYQKLRTLSKVDCIIGDVVSTATLAFAPLVNSDKVPLISPASSAPAITQAGEYIFRVWPSDAFEAATLFKYISTKHYSKTAVIFVNNDYGLAVVDSLNRALQGASLALGIRESFTPRSTDFRSQLQKVVSSDADSLIILAYPDDARPLLRQARESGIKVPIIGTSALADEAMLKSEPAAEGIVLSHPKDPDATLPQVKSFQEAYKKRFGKEPGLASDRGYDCVVLLAQAFASAKDGPAVIRILATIKDHPGASGSITFDENGDVQTPAGMKTVKDGKIEWMEGF